MQHTEEMDAYKCSGNLGAKAFLIFGGCIFVTVIWSYFHLPGTANPTLAEIDEMCGLKLPMRKWRGTSVFNMGIDTDTILGYRTSSTSDAIMQQMESRIDTA